MARVGESATTLASRVLFIAVAFGTTSYVASITVTPLVGEDLTKSAALSGLPWATGVFGTGLGSVLLSALMARRGRGPGLILGNATGAFGAAFAIVAIVNGSFGLFLLAVLAMGVGNSANHLSRYAAADLYPPERRASGLSMVVWAGTIGGVAGPALLDPSGRLAMDVDLPRLSGPFVVGALGTVIAAIAVAALVGRIPGALRAHDFDEASGSKTRLADMWRVPRARAALIALAVSQTVMVLIMAMTPLHMRSTGHGLGSVGFVISLHVFGMYGLSPVAGRLTDRFGPIRVILAGFATLMLAAFIAAGAPEHAGAWLAIPLLLLGFGWSLSFVAGSALLTEGLSYTDRARLQGATDSVVWTAAGIAGLSSGVLVDVFGYALLCLVGALLVIAPVLMIGGRRRALAEPLRTG